MPKTRGHGEGALYSRTDVRGRVRWYAELYLGKDEAGKKRVWRYSSFSKAETNVALAQAILDQERGSLAVTPHETLARYLERWLEGLRPSVEPRWYAEVKRYAEGTIVPRLGDLQLRQLNALAIQQFVSRLEAEGRGPYWVQKCHGVLRHALNDAVRWQILANNPAAFVKVPKTRKRDLTLWQADELQKFLRAVESDPDRDLYVLAILTGARAGELLALTWHDVDWERRTVSLQRAVSREPGSGLIVKDTKTPSSRRLVSLPAQGILALRRQAARVAEWARSPGYQDRGLVFCKRNGDVRSDEGPRRKLERIAAELGIAVLTFHDLRHLSASLSLALGADLRTVQARLGHSSVDVTGDIYAHLIGGQDRELAEKLGAVVGLPTESQRSADRTLPGDEVSRRIEATGSMAPRASG